MIELERSDGVGGELVLRQDGEHFEIISNGVFLMDTRSGESERLLVRVAVTASPGSLLIGGLGVGFSLAEAVSFGGGGSITVVEREPAVIRWHRGPLRRFSAGALEDPRVVVVQADLPAWLRSTLLTFDAICLDIDNGPEWTVTPGNAALYGDAGLDLLAQRLVPGGALAVWSAGASSDFAARLRERFTTFEVQEVPVPRGRPDIIYLAR